VTNDVGEGQAGIRVQLQHIGNQIFELFSIEFRLLVLLMLLPENISFALSDESVVGICWVGGVEWRVTRVQDEENDSESEQINVVSLVELLCNQLRGHVRSSSEDGSQETRTVLALDICSETKIREPDIELFVKHNVFGLQITVRYTIDMHVVHNLEALLEVVTTDRLGEGLKCNEVKQFATCDQFEHEVGNWDFRPVRFLPLCVFFELKKINHVRVLKLLVNLNFLFECFNCFRRVAWVCFVENL
jgi:hypothetical protein